MTTSTIRTSQDSETHPLMDNHTEDVEGGSHYGSNPTEAQARIAEYVERRGCFCGLFTKKETKEEFKKREITRKSIQLGDLADDIFSNRWRAAIAYFTTVF